MMVINNNLPALNAYDVVNNTSNQLQKSIQKLSTGLRINSAADDAAGLSISEKMRAQISGLDQAVRNTQDGISLIQTAEGALTETHSILQRMRELSVQAANDTYTAQDRSYIQEEVDLLREEIDHIGNTTTFNTKKLLNGDSAAIWGSSDLDTKAVIRGGLRDIDAYGQKSSAEGNYKITVAASAGTGQVQKSEIFRIKHDVNSWQATANTDLGMAASSAQEEPTVNFAGSLRLEGEVINEFDTAHAATARIVAATGDGSTASIAFDTTAITEDASTASGAAGATGTAAVTNGVSEALQNNYNLTLTVSAKDDTAGTVTFTVKGDMIAKNGEKTANAIDTTLTLDTANTATLMLEDNVSLTDSVGNTYTDDLGLTFAAMDADELAKLAEGDAFVINVNAQAKAGEDTIVTISGSANNSDEIDFQTHKYTINNTDVTAAAGETNTESFDVYYDIEDKTIDSGTVSMTTNENFATNVKTGTLVTYYKTLNTASDIDAATKLTHTEGDISGEWQADTANFSDSIASGSVTSAPVNAGDYITVTEGQATATTAADEVLTDLGSGLVAGKNNTHTATEFATELATWTSAAGGSGFGTAGGVDFSGYVKLEVDTVADGAITFKVSVKGTDLKGKAVDFKDAALSMTLDGTQHDLTVSDGATTYQFGRITKAAYTTPAASTAWTSGDEFAFTIGASATGTDIKLTVGGDNDLDTPSAHITKAVFNTASTDITMYAAKDTDTDGNAVGLLDLDWSTGSTDFATIALTTASTNNSDDGTTGNGAGVIAAFKVGQNAADVAAQTTETDKGITNRVGDSSIGQVAGLNNRLYDLEQFWDSQGNFMLEDPQTITITQGDGKTAKVTLYKYDTIEDVVGKLNTAIADDLGQAKYLNKTDANYDEALKKFVTFVEPGSADVQTSESVEGTMLVRSIAPGSNGTLNFSSNNEDLVNALALNTIQKADDSVYYVTVEDAHTGATVNDITDERITGNVLVGRLHRNVDVEFDSMSGITAAWDDKAQKFTLSGAKDAGTAGETTYLHLSDNTMVFQIGANEGDDMGINIGDMRSHALGLDGVLVTDREAASRSISIIDSAIDKVSTQRAKLGAYQNRLEHTAANLTTSAENLTAAESRIRDTDMAKEMMNFTKLQIMLQAGNSMLAQANQLPQNVLSLIR